MKISKPDAFYSFSDIRFMDLSTYEISEPQPYNGLATPIIPEGENKTYSMEDFNVSQSFIITLTRQQSWSLQAMLGRWPVTYTCREGWNRQIK